MSFRADHPDYPGGWWLVFAEPVQARSGDGGARVIGAVTLEMDPRTSLLPLTTGEEVPTRTGEAVLVERVGDAANFLSPLRHLQSGAPRMPLDSPRFAAAAALAGEERFGEFTDYRGVPVLAATRHISTTGWGLVAKVDREEAFAEYWQDLWQTATAGALVVFAFAGFILAESRRQRTRALEAALAAEQAVHDARERYRLLSEHAKDIVLFLAPGA